MKKNVASKTAEGTAAIRAAHYRYAAEPKVLLDSAAYELLSPIWRILIGSSLVYRIIKRFRKKRAGVFGCVVGRSRFAEDLLAEAMNDGIRQYVLLGAGLDTFAYRSPLRHKLKILELDHPATQAAKVARLKNRNIEIENNVRLMPIDFTEELVSQKLKEAGFLAEPIFFAWLGVMCYLEIPVIENLFRDLRAVCKPGTKIAFDYVDEELFRHPESAMGLVAKYARKRGEPIITGMNPKKLPAFLENLGWSLCTSVPPVEQNRRYFAQRRDGLVATEHVHFALAELR